MGYTTYFDGEFKVTPTLAPQHVAYLKQFSDTRRMIRNPEVASGFPDPLREAVGLPIGEQACFFVGGGGEFGQGRDESIVEYNISPGGGGYFSQTPPEDLPPAPDRAQPGLWCKWTPTEDGTAIVWNEAEKFYDYVEWLNYLVEVFLKPWGYSLTGDVDWEGEDSEDRGTIFVRDNDIRPVATEMHTPNPFE